MNIIKLSNGLRVANFSSPHDFKFEDGNILKACTDKRAEYFKVNFDETSQTILYHSCNVKTEHIKLDFSLSEMLASEINHILLNWEEENLFDILLIPLSMMNAIKNDYRFEGVNILDSPFRVIKMKSRLEKLVRIDKFCV